MPKLSIITINYNNLYGLKETIDSVISQTFTDFEWIVIDGGSTDGSRELIERFQNHFVYWCSEPDKGIYNAMNKGISHSKGDWFLFLNSGDCILNNTILDKIFTQDYTSEIIYGDVLYTSTRGDFTVTFPSELTLSYLLQMFISHQSSLYRRELFDTNMYNESFRIVSDWLFHIQMILQNRKFEYLPYVITKCDHNGISVNYEQLNKEERTRAIEQFLPAPIKRDMEFIETYSIFKRRKSFRIISLRAVKRCLRLDRVLKLIEKTRQPKQI